MILDRLGKELIYFDGGTGTLLQERGLKPGELPETWSLERADDMIDIARQYYEAGSDIVLSNTFGANALKFHDSRHKLDEIVKAAIENLKKILIFLFLLQNLQSALVCNAYPGYFLIAVFKIGSRRFINTECLFC